MRRRRSASASSGMSTRNGWIAVSSAAVPARAGCAARGVALTLTANTTADVARSMAEVVISDIVFLPACWSMRASVDRCRFGFQGRDQLGGTQDRTGLGRPIELVDGVHHVLRKGGRRIRDLPHPRPSFAALRDEIVIGIDEQQAGPGR